MERTENRVIHYCDFCSAESHCRCQHCGKDTCLEHSNYVPENNLASLFSLIRKTKKIDEDSDLRLCPDCKLDYDHELAELRRRFSHQALAKSGG